MSKKEEIIKDAEYLDMYKKGLQELVDTYLADKSNSLDDRWEVWTKYSTINTGDYIHHFPKEFGELDKEVNNGEWLGRGSIITYDRVVDSYVENCIGYELFGDDWAYMDEQWSTIENSDQLANLKEYLMKNNLRSYKFDW